jgi:hypothetical protein
MFERREIVVLALAAVAGCGGEEGTDDRQAVST